MGRRDHPYALRLRQLNRTPGANYDTFKKGNRTFRSGDLRECRSRGLIKVTCYLLDRQIERLEQDFLKEGGLRERMTRARISGAHETTTAVTQRTKVPGLLLSLLSFQSLRAAHWLRGLSPAAAPFTHFRCDSC